MYIRRLQIEYTTRVLASMQPPKSNLLSEN